MISRAIIRPIGQSNISSFNKKRVQDSGHIKQKILYFLTRDILRGEESPVGFVFIFYHNSLLSILSMIFIFPTQALRRHSVVKLVLPLLRPSSPHVVAHPSAVKVWRRLWLLGGWCLHLRDCRCAVGLLPPLNVNPFPKYPFFRKQKWFISG